MQAGVISLLLSGFKPETAMREHLQGLLAGALRLPQVGPKIASSCRRCRATRGNADAILPFVLQTTSALFMQASQSTCGRGAVHLMQHESVRQRARPGVTHHAALLSDSPGLGILTLAVAALCLVLCDKIDAVLLGVLCRHHFSIVLIGLQPASSAVIVHDAVRVVICWTAVCCHSGRGMGRKPLAIWCCCLTAVPCSVSAHLQAESIGLPSEVKHCCSRR